MVFFLVICRSIVLMSSSYFFLSWSYMSSIRWISLRIWPISLAPYSGSHSSCISFSSYIFRSQRQIYLSASVTSCKISPFSDFNWEIWFSSLIDSYSIYFSCCLKSFSTLKLSFASLILVSLAIWRASLCFFISVSSNLRDDLSTVISWVN
jgi:hypothetical protein